MIHKINAGVRQYLAAPVFTGDEEEIRRARLLNTTTSMVLLFFATLIPARILDDPTKINIIIIDVIALMGTFLLYFLLRRGKVTLVASALIVLVFAWTTAEGMVKGTVRTPTTSTYIFVVVLAGLLFNRRGILISSLASSMAVLGLVLAENAGLLPHPDYTVTLIQWIIYTYLVGITGSLGFYSNQTTHQALAQAQKEIVRREQAETELYKLIRAVEQSPASIMVTDLRGNIEYVNPRFTQVTGYEFGEVLGKKPSILKTGLTPSETHLQLWNALANGEEWHGEFVNRKKDGSLYYESATISPIIDSRGQVTHYLAVKEDITERMGKEHALRESEARFRIMFESHGAIMIIMEPESGKILDANQAAESFYGYARAELKSMYIHDLNMLSKEEIAQARRNALEGTINYFVFPHRLANGNVRTVEVYSSPITFNEQRVIFSIIHDITQRKHMENELQHWAQIFEHAEWGITIGSGDQKTLELMNPAFAKMHGYTVNELTGKPIIFVFAPEAWADVPVNIKIAHERGHYTWESVHIRRDGSRFPVLIDVTAVHDDQGVVLHRIVNVQDLTARKQAEAALLESEARWQFALEGAGDGVWDWNVQTNKVFLSRQWKTMLGYAEADIGDALDEWLTRVHPQDLAHVQDEVKKHFRGQTPVYISEHRVLCKDGSYKWVLDRGKIIEWTTDHDPLRVIGTHADITERKQMEDDLRQSTEMYRLLAENVSDVIWILDISQKRFRYVSPSVERMRGYTVEEILGQELSAVLTPDSLQVIQESYPARLQSFQDGQRLFYVDELAQLRKDGSIVWTESTTNLQINETNGHLEIYGVSRDITERKRNETIIQARLELLEYAADHPLDEFMRAALDRIASLTGSTIGFYHFVEPDQKTLSLQVWSTRTLMEFCKTEGKGLHYDINSAGVWVDCVRDRKPVIHNDYASLTHRKGLPPGHAPVLRELVVPVYRGEKITSILGVGNKPVDYDESDMKLVSYLADVFWEIVKRKQAEQNLNELESRLRLLSHNLEGAGLFVYSHDIEGKAHYEYLSTSMEILTGINTDDALRNASSLQSVILPEYLPLFLQRETRSKQDLLAFEMEVCQRHAVSGEIRWMLLRSTPRRRPDGSTVWYGVQMDITERKRSEKLLELANEQLRLQVEEIKLHAELREQSVRDPLTGLYNRRYLNEMMDREITRARRENDQVSIIISDIDHFKTINDTYGHQVGDKMLVEIARIIKNNARSSDIVCRYGGEEFLLVVPGASLEDAGKRADEIRLRCEDLIHRHEGEDLRITMSFGVATYPVHGREVEEVLIKADKALYQSKNLGRNRVTVWDTN